MNFKERITKESNLDINDSLSAYMGHAAQQNHNVYEVFYNFLNDVRPKRILEIGTALGGFTKFLKLVSDELNLDIKILSLDIHYNPWYVEMIDSGIDIRVENVFNSDYTEVYDYVKNFMQSEGTTLVLCDGGDKVREFNLLSKHIKVNDFIMAHDYAENSEVFKQTVDKKIWNWHEISDSDIIHSCNENNVKIYQKENFENVAWTCRRKEL